jgi:hypothetical protein
MNEEAWIAKETLRQLLHQSISAVLPSYTPDSDKHRKLLGLPLKVIVEVYSQVRFLAMKWRWLSNYRKKSTSLSW